MGPNKSRDRPPRDAGNPRAHATRPRRFESEGSGPLKESSGMRTEAQGMRQRTLEHAHSVPRGTVADKAFARPHRKNPRFPSLCQAGRMAFGPSRHRAWVVGQSPKRCFLGSLRRALESLFGWPREPLGGLLGALGADLGRLGPKIVEIWAIRSGGAAAYLLGIGTESAGSFCECARSLASGLEPCWCDDFGTTY